MKIFVKLVVMGILSGLVLGGYLKIVEQLTAKQVYTLLLNVDYLPIIQDWSLSEIQEFSLHMVVSVWLAIALYFILGSDKIFPYVILSVLIGALLYLTTVLSDQTPLLTDTAAFVYWLMGHLIYGIIIGILASQVGIDRNEEKNEKSNN
ncbi:hypothetical protein ACUL41_01715 [Virgibacillus natechei]|uniref:hypothetical protein n=1 Tax=Virgibacillus sp. CBA3643 TaxID=2942278 RepID=UPI0035A35EBC